MMAPRISFSAPAAFRSQLITEQRTRAEPYREKELRLGRDDPLRLLPPASAPV